MSKRETIFLGGIALAAAVFLIDRLMPSGNATDDQVRRQTAQAEAFVGEQRQLLLMAGLKPYETITLDMLTEEPPSNPFARQWVSAVADQKRIGSLSAISPVLSYSGYICHGNRFIALINDEEYEVGDKIKDVPLVIRGISPEKIDVENPHTISQSKLSIKILPLETDDE